MCSGNTKETENIVLAFQELTVYLNTESEKSVHRVCVCVCWEVGSSEIIHPDKEIVKFKIKVILILEPCIYLSLYHPFI